MTESLNGGGTNITVNEKSLLFELLSLLLKHRLSCVLLCEELYDCWPTKDSWGGLVTEIFNGGKTYITGDDNSLLFEWLSLRLNHRLSRGVIHCLTLLFPVPLLWQQPIPFGRDMMNVTWVCGGVVHLLFCLSMFIKRWQPTFWRDNCSNVWVSVPGIKLVTRFLSQYHPNYAIKYYLSEKGH